MVERSGSQSLQITIVLAGQAPFLSQLVFPATYATPSTGTPACGRKPDRLACYTRK